MPPPRPLGCVLATWVPNMLAVANVIGAQTSSRSQFIPVLVMILKGMSFVEFRYFPLYVCVYKNPFDILAVSHFYLPFVSSTPQAMTRGVRYDRNIFFPRQKNKKISRI